MSPVTTGHSLPGYCTPLHATNQPLTPSPFDNTNAPHSPRLLVSTGAVIRGPLSKDAAEEEQAVVGRVEQDLSAEEEDVVSSYRRIIAVFRDYMLSSSSSSGLSLVAGTGVSCYCCDSDYYRYSTPFLSSSSSSWSLLYYSTTACVVVVAVCGGRFETLVIITSSWRKQERKDEEGDVMYWVLGCGMAWWVMHRPHR